MNEKDPSKSSLPLIFLLKNHFEGSGNKIIPNDRTVASNKGDSDKSFSREVDIIFEFFTKRVKRFSLEKCTAWN